MRNTPESEAAATREPETEFATRVVPALTRERSAPQETSAGTHDVLVCLPDEDHALQGARLWSDVDLGGDLDFDRVDRGWQLRLTDLPVDRLEYLLEVRDGERVSSILDRTNPRLVGGAFGDHSWLPLPEYRQPTWLEEPGVAGSIAAGGLPDTPIGDVDWLVWSPAESPPDEPLPLLIAHDGPEMAELADLTRFTAVMIARGRLPSCRVALMVPGDRDPRYAANPRYGETLCENVLPALLQAHPSQHAPALLGASLGAVAALHASWWHPTSFGGLFLASGSFFDPDLDPQEAQYAHWSAITEFVETVRTAENFGADSAGNAAPPHVAVVCGSAEENLANNEAMTQALRRLGLDVSWGSVRDGHCYTCWRDLFDPWLTELLTSTWSRTQ